MRLEGKVALVTGSARGIGAGIARVFAREGASVVVTDVLDDEGQRYAQQLNERGGTAAFVHLDATREGDWRNAVDTALRTYGKLDILVNNAGGGGGTGSTLFEDGAKEAFDRVMEVNATSTFLGTRAVVDAMRRAGGGCIINISSVYGIIGAKQGLGGSPGYNAAKGAVRLFTKATALQLAPSGIRVNSIHPGVIQSHGVLSRLLSSEEQRQRYQEVTPIGRLGEPEDIGYGALFLADDASSFVTGAELVIDGGWTAQ